MHQSIVHAVLLSLLTILPSAALSQPIGPADLQLVASPGRVRVPEILDAEGVVGVNNAACGGDVVQVEFSIRNFGPQNGQIGTILIERDGVTVSSFQNLDILTSGSQRNFSVDVALPAVSPPAGNSTTDITVSFTGVGDTTPFNEATRIVTVTRCLPDLGFVPPAPGAPLLALSTDGDPLNTQASFDAGDPVLLDAVWFNLGQGDMTGGYSVDIVVNGVLVSRNGPLPPLAVNEGLGFDDTDISSVLIPGSNTVAVVVDSLASVEEENEDNNTVSVSIDVISSGLPDLLPFTPIGWSDPLVVDTQTGSFVTPISVEAGVPVFIDIAWANLGISPASTFDVGLFLDGGFLGFVTSTGLGDGFLEFVDDIELAPLAPGMHEFLMIVDNTDSVVESDEGNNTFSLMIEAISPVCLADTNGDGLATPADFSAWIIAFNNQLPQCDQNGDGICVPSDFSAWIINFNAGCP